MHCIAGFKGRFHQYYITGSYADCKRWQQDYKHCLQFRNTGDTEAAVSVVLWIVTDPVWILLLCCSTNKKVVILIAIGNICVRILNDSELVLLQTYMCIQETCRHIDELVYFVGEWSDYLLRCFTATSCDSLQGHPGSWILTPPPPPPTDICVYIQETCRHTDELVCFVDEQSDYLLCCFTATSCDSLQGDPGYWIVPPPSPPPNFLTSSLLMKLF